MVDYGLRDLGYHYVILDDCWSSGRTPNGTLQANATKFPNGMAAVADQIHNMGLGYGMYSSAGAMTCAQYPGSLGVEKQDASTFASWGVDYLKYDNCYNEGQYGTALISYSRYNAMSQALNATGRSILYSMCNWGQDQPWNWAQTMANSWRISGDVYDSFDRPDDRCPCTDQEGNNCQLPGFHCSIMNIVNKAAYIGSKAQPGAWNDMDMLEVGNGGMTDDEQITHFTMWAILKSPLIIGTNVPAMSPQALSIYSNPAVIAINQDPAGSEVKRNWRYFVNDTDQYGQGEIQLWTGSLANGDYVVCLLNAGNSPRSMNATLTEIFFDESSAGSVGPAPQLMQQWDVYDLWANRISNATAMAIINNNSTSGSNYTVMNNKNSTTRYNATEISYAQGLAMNATALFGSKVGSVSPMGTLTAEVAGHGVALFRLRSQGTPSMRKRDEL
ncbi:MAG: hypothetical protein LQ347_003309 [Umbilicaria vellea]|nr:MAG: hypothetical protein LQ347_003309 [Umbilicaria vellea]